MIYFVIIYDDFWVIHATRPAFSITWPLEQPQLLNDLLGGRHPTQSTVDGHLGINEPPIPELVPLGT